jgi:post-segregation antitoxin (ccd killing protein)
MGYSKISVSVPDGVLSEAKALASKKKINLSRFVASALAEKTRSMKEELLLKRINEAFADPEIAKEQRSMAKAIAGSTESKELPW